MSSMLGRFSWRPRIARFSERNGSHNPDASRNESGSDCSEGPASTADLNPVKFNLLAWLSRTLRPLEALAREKGLELACDVRPDVPEIVFGDQSRLREVLHNLVSNAIRHAEGGVVSVRVETQRRDADECLLHFIVRDTGVGFPKDSQNAISGALPQAGATEAGSQEETNHRWVASRQAVEMQGGHIWVERELGHVSRFHFTLPFGVYVAADMAQSAEDIGKKGGPGGDVDEDSFAA